MNVRDATIHHFKRVTYYSDPQDLNNLMTLCRKCHKIIEGDKHRLDVYLNKKLVPIVECRNRRK